MLTGNEGLLGIDWLKYNISTNYNLCEEDYQDLINNVQFRLGFTFELRVLDIDKDLKRNTRYNNNLAINAMATLYLFSKLNLFYILKFINSVFKRKVPKLKKSRKRIKS